VLHTLLGVGTHRDLMGHPKVGASWEGFAIQQIIERLRATPRESFFWALHTGAELDLLIVQGRRRRGFEVKLSDSPHVTPSMRSAIENLRLDSLDVLHAGAETFPLGKKIRAVPVRELWSPGFRL
jgi:uncharacterized protein